MKETTTMDEIWMDDMEELEIAIRNAVRIAEDIARRAGCNDMRNLESEMEAYLIPHLQSWVDDERQMGSVPSLTNTLNEYNNEEDNDGDA
jgi:hypothetical protein